MFGNFVSLFGICSFISGRVLCHVVTIVLIAPDIVVRTNCVSCSMPG